MKRALLAAAIGAASVVSLAAMADSVPSEIPVTGSWVTGHNTKTCARIEWNAGVAKRYLVTNTDGTKLIVPNPTSSDPLTLTRPEQLIVEACEAHKAYTVLIDNPLRVPAPVPSRVLIDWVNVPSAH